jgi:hypothetical protein
LAYFERYLGIPLPARIGRSWGRVSAGVAGATRAVWEPIALKRAGELYDAANDRARAIEYYTRFAALWAHADPELQPAVSAVRKRLAELERRKGK